MNTTNPYRNASGCSDPTAFYALRNAQRDERGKNPAEAKRPGKRRKRKRAGKAKVNR